jgi:hypothetical protein
MKKGIFLVGILCFGVSNGMRWYDPTELLKRHIGEGSFLDEYYSPRPVLREGDLLGRWYALIGDLEKVCSSDHADSKIKCVAHRCLEKANGYFSGGIIRDGIRGRVFFQEHVILFMDKVSDFLRFANGKIRTGEKVKKAAQKVAAAKAVAQKVAAVEKVEADT